MVILSEKIDPLEKHPCFFSSFGITSKYVFDFEQGQTTLA